MKISVIMPVYKIEEYFAADDGSPDNSGIICDKYASKDSRMKVIRQKNQGAPAARNAELLKASAWTI